MSVVGVIYACTVIALLVEGQPFKALMFIGYVVAQVGIVLDVTHGHLPEAPAHSTCELPHTDQQSTARAD